MFFNHRPLQNNAVSPDVLCRAYGIPYKQCKSDVEITEDCDYYIVTGSGILSEEMLRGKKVINAHPGIIPAARGLDSFKWSIFNLIPLGVTLHYIDSNIDMGKIISVIPTPVFITDSLETLSRRHYENEINVLIHFERWLSKPRNEYSAIEVREAARRMPFETEVKMARRFEEYKRLYALPYL